MSFLQSLILGIIQGLTEFLPISSSAHLVLVPYILNWSIPESQIFPFDVLVQLGTLAAVIIYFWKDLWRIIKAFVTGILQRKPFDTEDSRMGWYLVLATIPAGLAGVFLKDTVEAAFNNPRITAIFLFVTAVLLVAAEFFGRRTRKLEKMTWLDALWVGIFQAFSIFPGISRSGSTITGGMTRNFDRPSAARFAFLMSIPIMLAAGIFSLPDLIKVPDLGSFLPILIVGFIAAGVVGYLSIHWLLSFLTKRSLIYFAAYCVLLGSAVLIIMGIRQANPQPAAPIAAVPGAANTTESTDEILYIDMSPSLDWLAPHISDCTSSTAGLTVVMSAAPAASSGTQSLQLRWGQPPALDRDAVVIGEDELVFIVNPENTLEALPLEVLQQMASGKIKDWNGVFSACPECFSAQPSDELYDLPVEFLLYPEGDDARVIFEESVLADSPLADSTALILPSPTAMNAEVASVINAFGFLPALAVDNTVATVALMQGTEEFSTKQPILAITSSEPQAAVVEWLACLQAQITR